MFPRFQYYWDDTETLGDDMGTPADIQKLIQKAQRAQALTDRAANSGTDAENVMNNFEQTMNRFDAHFGGIKEYDKQIQAMLGATSNGGPPLDATFPSTTAVSPSSTVHPPIDHATGDPIKT